MVGMHESYMIYDKLVQENLNVCLSAIKLSIDF